MAAIGGVQKVEVDVVLDISLKTGSTCCYVFEDSADLI
jgi:hypothetical protein